MAAPQLALPRRACRLRRRADGRGPGRRGASPAATGRSRRRMGHARSRGRNEDAPACPRRWRRAERQAADPRRDIRPPRVDRPESASRGSGRVKLVFRWRGIGRRSRTSSRPRFRSDAWSDGARGSRSAPSARSESRAGAAIPADPGLALIAAETLGFMVACPGREIGLPPPHHERRRALSRPQQAARGEGPGDRTRWNSQPTAGACRPGHRAPVPPRHGPETQPAALYSAGHLINQMSRIRMQG
jgi:hypothetical protein